MCLLFNKLYSNTFHYVADFFVTIYFSISQPPPTLALTKLNMPTDADGIWIYYIISWNIPFLSLYSQMKITVIVFFTLCWLLQRVHRCHEVAPWARLRSFFIWILFVGLSKFLVHFKEAEGVGQVNGGSWRNEWRDLAILITGSFSHVVIIGLMFHADDKSLKVITGKACRFLACFS